MLENFNMRMWEIVKETRLLDYAMLSLGVMIEVSDDFVPNSAFHPPLYTGILFQMAMFTAK